MRPRAIIYACLLALALVPAAGAVSARQAISYLNAERAANGIPAGIDEVPQWSANCALHLNYEAKTHTFGHEEDPASPYYTPGGAWAGLRSVLSDGGEFKSRADNPWLQAPLHLDGLLTPQLEQSGYADGAGGVCMVVGDDDFDFNRHLGELYTYPGDGSVGAPPSVDSHNELPTNPAEALGLDNPTGTNILVFAHLEPFGNTKIVAASLSGPDGPHQVRWADDTSPLGMNFSWGGIVVPVKPLAPGTRYTASVTVEPADLAGPPLTRTWSFTTGLWRNEVGLVSAVTRFAAPAPLKLSGMSTAKVVELTATRIGSDTVVSRGSARTIHDGGFTGLIRVPLGRWSLCATSGGGSTSYDRARDCVEVTTRRDRRKPQLQIASASARRVAHGWKLELWAQGRDEEGLPPRCSFRVGSAGWRPCRFHDYDGYAIIRRTVPARPSATVSFRATDYAGNRASVTAPLYLR
jgi:hypothetical protein